MGLRFEADFLHPLWKTPQNLSIVWQIAVAHSEAIAPAEAADAEKSITICDKRILGLRTTWPGKRTPVRLHQEYDKIG